MLRSLARGRGRTRRLSSVYFDTPRLDLKAAGAALRIGQIDRRRVQTVKLPVDGQPGLQAFREIEVDVADDVPDLTRVQDEAMNAHLSDRGIGADLSPVFATEFRRTVWPITLQESEIEVAFDVGEIRANERRMSISEVDLELKSGNAARLTELALALHREVPVAWEYDTKAVRGYRLAAD